MTVLTIEIPDKETKFVTKFIKKIGGKVTDSQPICDRDNAPMPQAIEDLRAAKGTSYKSVKDLVESIDKHPKKSRVKKQLLTGLETGLKQAKEIQAGKSKGFSITEIVNGK